MALILDGKEASASIKEALKREVETMVANGMRPPHLVAIMVGENGASETYVASKQKACEEVGFRGTVIRYPAEVEEQVVLDKIAAINQEGDIDGLIVQLPLPPHISEKKVTESIAPNKDVDGFHDVNMGRLAKGLDGFLPATPYGITLMLEHFGIEVSGKHAVVVGRSNIVGKPMSLLLSSAASYGNATVTLCHSRTSNLAAFTKMADLLVVALGKPEFISADMVKEGAVVIDVGITRVEDSTRKRGYRVVGDVKYQEVAEKASAITPVPGGVGLMTIAGLLANTLKARKLQILSRTA